MTAQEAMDYGLMDKIIYQQDDKRANSELRCQYHE